MKTKYICRGLIGLYIKIHNNRTMWSINLHVEKLQVGGKGKRAKLFSNIKEKLPNSENTRREVMAIIYALCIAPPILGCL